MSLKLNKKVNKKVIYLLLFVSACSFIWLLRVFLLGSYPDFSTYYFGAQHFLLGENPYLSDQNYFTPQVYPPFTMLFFVPFILFSYDIASKIWIGISIITFILSIYLITKIHKETLMSEFVLLLIILSLAAFPLKFTLGMGQLNAVLLLFITLFYYFLRKKSDAKAGIFLVLPLILKFFPLIILPYLFIAKKWKLLIVCLSIAGGLLTVTTFAVSFPIVNHYYTNILPELVFSWKGDYYNQSLAGVLLRIFPNEQIASTFKTVLSFFFICATFIPIILYKNKTQQRVGVEIASLISVNVLINNFSWQHHYIFLTLPFFIIAFTLKQMHMKNIYYVILFICYVLVASNLKNPATFPVFIQNHVFFGGLFLWMLSIYLLMRMNELKPYK